MLFGVLETLRAERLMQALATAMGLNLSAAELAAFDKPFVEHPVMTAVHIIPAFLFIVLAPLQFSSRIRGRHLRVHRWSGRMLVVLGVLFGSSALFFGLRTPFGGKTEASAVAVFGVLFLGSLIKAFADVRKGDVIGHRRWMTRAFGIVLGIAMMRLVLPALMSLADSRVQAVFGLAVWIGFAITAVTAEVWIRCGRAAIPATPARARTPAPSPAR
jgi:uncharacterized membrane protein